MTREELERALRRLGMLVRQQNFQIELFAVGGGALALGFNLRNITRDLDAIILKPEEGQPERRKSSDLK